MKAIFKETFNTLSLPVTIMAEWAQESDYIKQLCNLPLDKISDILNTDYNPDFIANHIGTSAGAYLFATLIKHQYNIQDKIYDNIPIRDSLENNNNTIFATFSSVACVTTMETWQMLERGTQFDWADFNTCMVSLGLFVLVNKPNKQALPITASP